MWVVGDDRVREKAEMQFGERSNRLNPLTTCGVKKAILVPDRNDVGPSLPLLLWQFTNAADGQVDFHVVSGLLLRPYISGWL